MRRDGLEERGAVLARIGPADKVEQRVRIPLGGPVIENETQRSDAFGDHPHRPVDDGIASVAFPRKRRIAARSPARAPTVLECDQPRHERGLRLGRREHFPDVGPH